MSTKIPQSETAPNEVDSLKMAKSEKSPAQVSTESPSISKVRASSDLYKYDMIMYHNGTYIDISLGTSCPARMEKQT